MRRRATLIAGMLGVALLAACGRQQTPPPAPAPAAAPPPPAATAGFIAAAVGDESRPAIARVRDADRKPAEVLAFSGIRPGDAVVEIQPAGGYFTALLSRVVGPQGRVYAVDSERLFEFMPRLRESFTGYAATDPRDNVEYSSQYLDAIELPDQVDQVWMVQFYHDTIWTSVDRTRMNQAFFRHLKPGGVYLVIDHRGLDGAGEEIARDIHRADPQLVRAEIEAAGFVLAGTSDVLAHPDDRLDVSVFDETLRGRTDQFVWKFIKPVD